MIWELRCQGNNNPEVEPFETKWSQVQNDANKCRRIKMKRKNKQIEYWTTQKWWQKDNIHVNIQLTFSRLPLQIHMDKRLHLNVWKWNECVLCVLCVCIYLSISYNISLHHLYIWRSLFDSLARATMNRNFERSHKLINITYGYGYAQDVRIQHTHSHSRSQTKPDKFLIITINMDERDALQMINCYELVSIFSHIILTFKTLAKYVVSALSTSLHSTASECRRHEEELREWNSFHLVTW